MILVQFDAETGEQDMEFTKWVESLTQEELQVEVLKLHEERKALERIEIEEMMSVDKGKYRGSINIYAEVYGVDEEYEEYLDTLTPEELEAERLQLEMQMLAIDNMGFDHRKE